MPWRGDAILEPSRRHPVFLFFTTPIRDVLSPSERVLISSNILTFLVCVRVLGSEAIRGSKESS